MINILYVDDETDLLEVGKLFLERCQDIGVDVAQSVAIAKDILEHKRYDAIISDYQMPEMSGIDFLKWLRTNGNDIPFILFTGKGREEIVIEALNSGADFYLQKGGNATAQFRELDHKVRETVRRNRAEEALQSNEERLRRAQEIGKTGCWEFVLDSDGGHVWGSEEAFKLFGIERPIDGVIPQDQLEKCMVERERTHQALQNLFEKGSEYDLEYEIAPADCSPHKIIHSLAEQVRDADGRLIKIAGVIQDVTERKQVDVHVRKLNRELVAIKECDRALVKARSEQELLDSVCRIVCDVAGYRMAWIGMKEINDERTVCPVAWSGYDEGYVAQIKASWGDDDRGKGPTGEAIKSGKTVFIQDFALDKRMSPWRELAMKNGYRSCIAMPLMDSGVSFGSFMLYSDQIDGFTTDEVNLLEEMAGDLAFGILGLRAQRVRLLVEKILKESEEEFRSLADNAFEGIAISIDGTLISMNKTLVDLLGIKPNEAIGKSMFDYFTPESRMIVREQLKTPSTRPYEAQIYASNGEIRTIKIHGKDITWKGKPARLGAVQDITEEKQGQAALLQSEQALQKSETLYHAIFDHASVGIILVNQDGTGMEVNDKMSSILGYTKDELSGTHVKDFSHPDDWAKDIEQFTALMANQIDEYEIDKRYIRKDGTIAHGRVSISLVDPSDRSHSRILGIVNDVTNQRMAEEGLRRSEEKYRNYVENSISAFTVADRSGRYIDANQAACDLLGYTRQELLEMSVPQIIPIEQFKTSISSTAALMPSGRSKQELKLRKKDGTMVPVLVNAFRLPNETLMAVFTDPNETIS